MKRKLIGIDLGSDSTRIYSSITSSVIFNEPSVVAINSNNQRIIETGFLASRIQGKTPYNYQIVRPVVEGIVNDDDAAYGFLSNAFREYDQGIRGCGLVLSGPSKMSKVNKNALIEIGKRLQAKEIYLESQAKLAALGAGQNIYSPCATLVCNIGAGISDIACISMGEIVSSTTSHIAGDMFDEAIRRYMIQEKHLEIGKKNAQSIKMRIGSVSPVSDGSLVEVKGKDTINSLPTSAIVSSSELKKCLIPLASFLSLKISDVIHDLEPELSSDLVQSGLVLTGGSASLMGLKEYLQNSLAIPVHVSDNPQNAVINGIGMYISRIDEAKR